MLFRKSLKKGCANFIQDWENYFQVNVNIPKSTVMGWFRAKLSFNLLKSINICIRGSRAKNLKEMIESNQDDTINDIAFAYVLSIEK